MSGYEKSPDYGGRDPHPFVDVVLAIVVCAAIIGIVVLVWAR